LRGGEGDCGGGGEMISILDSDDLEEYNSEYLENILNEKVEDYKEIKRRIKEYVEIVLPHLLKNLLNWTQKFNKALSFFLLM
jgi:hypothetical protein